jgi:uncharacterized membrane protein YgaE (UPF0421/DUF939 family)
MSAGGGREQARRRMVRRAGLVAAILVVVALLFLTSGHWLLGLVLAIAAVAAVWVFLQLRSVR